MALLVRTLRAAFFTATLVPVLLGTAIAWHEGSFHGGYFLLTLVGALAIHAGLNTANDYFDHLSGNDELNREPTPFSGGSRVIQEGLVSARSVLLLSLTCFAIGIAVGLYLAWARGMGVLFLGIVGVFLAFFYNAPPLQFSYLGHGLGELAVGLGFGPVMTLGAYYVQSRALSWRAFWASIPVAFLIVAVLYINEFPDYAADKATHKNTLVVVLGRERAVWGYVALMSLAYLSLVAGVALRLLPWLALLGLLTVPTAWRAILRLRRFHSQIPQLIPANAATIQIHLITGLLLCLSYGLDRLLGT